MMMAVRTEQPDEKREDDFDQDHFIPSVYNKTYYSSVMQDELALIQWQAGPLDERLRRHMLLQGIESFPLMLDLGSGPAVHHLLALAKYADVIHVADYMEENLTEIEKWVDNDSDAHDWEIFMTTILEHEGHVPTPALMASREQEVRVKIREYSRFDLKKPSSRLPTHVASLVTSFFVADSATRSKDVFARMTRNAFQFVEPSGLFVATYLGGCARYRVGRRWINSASISESDIRRALLGAGAKKIDVWRFETPTMDFDGFDHIFAVVAEK
jgi:hypothetical protein